MTYMFILKMEIFCLVMEEKERRKENERKWRSMETGTEADFLSTKRRRKRRRIK